MVWFDNAIIGVVAGGVGMALLKVPTSKGYSKFSYFFLAGLVSSFLALIFYYKYIVFDYSAIILAFLWGTGYAMASMLQMHILKKIDASSIFPITTIMSQVLVVIIGLTFFKDQIRFLQFIGMVLAFVIILSFNYTHKHITLKNGLFLNALGIVALSAGTKFVQKVGSVSGNVYNCIFWQLFFSMIATLVMTYIFEIRKGISLKNIFPKKVFPWSIFLGTINFCGTSMIVRALSTGPFSLVNAVLSFYIVVMFIIAWKFFDEIMTVRKAIFIFLSLGAMLLIRLG